MLSKVLGSKKNKITESLNQESVIKDVIAKAKNLIDTLEKENAILRAGKTSQVKNIAEKKVAAVAKFSDAQAVIERYIRSGGEFEQNTPSMQALKELFSKLDAAKRDNEILISSNLEVSGQMIEIYKKVKIQESKRNYGYDEKGKVPDNKSKNVDPAFGLNNKI